MGNQEIAFTWLNQALNAIEQWQSEVDFLAHAHPGNRNKARAAYKAAAKEKAAKAVLIKDIARDVAEQADLPPVGMEDDE